MMIPALSNSFRSTLSPVFSGVRVARSLVFCVMLCRSFFVVVLLSFFLLAIVFVVCLSIYGFWLPLWYFQTLLAALDCNSDRWLKQRVVSFSFGKCIVSPWFTTSNNLFGNFNLSLYQFYCLRFYAIGIWTWWSSPTLGNHHWVDFEHNCTVTCIIGIWSFLALKKKNL